MLAAGHLCMGEPIDQFAFAQDAGAYRHGYIFQVWAHRST
jgi:hypothetical protein